MSTQDVIPSAARNPVTAIREGTLFTRGTVAVVLTTFLALILSPTAAAAREVVKGAPVPASQFNAHGETLNELVVTLRYLEGTVRKGGDTGPLKAELKTLNERLAVLDREGESECKATERALLKLNFAKALARHREAASKVRQQAQTVHAQLEALLAISAAPALATAAKALRLQLEAMPTGNAHEPFDPNGLPFHMPDGKVRAPKASAKDLQRALDPNLKKAPAFVEPLPDHLRRVEASRSDDGGQTSLAKYAALWGATEPVEVAAAGAVTSLLAVSAVTPPGTEYFAPTEDVQITQPIRDLAAQLRNNPVEIFNWVRNNIEFLPTYGSIQGSDLTLLTKRGNAYDTASLLIALLRAASIPARYAYGTVQLPAAVGMNWIGGMESADAAAELMSQGGIPNASVTSGGTVTAFRLEHVWVEAFVDFYPSRGAKNLAPDTWAPMDPSFKQYAYTTGMNLPQSVPFDAQALLSDVQANAEVNEAESWVRGIDEPIVQNALTSYQTRLQDYVNSQKPDATVGDVLGAKTIVASTAPVLAASLPYRLIAAGNRYAALPSTLRHTVKLEFFANSTDRTYENPEFTVERGLPSLAGKRMSLIYEPASEEDKQALASAFDNYETSFAAYAIDFKPTLKLEAETLGSAAASMTGTAQYLRVTTRAPWYERPRDYPLKSGDTMALALNAAGVTPAQFEARTRAHDLSDGDDPDFTAEMFYQVALGYWGEEEAFASILGGLDGVISHMMPSHGIAGAPVQVTYRYGVPSRATYNSRILDVKEILLTAEHKQGHSRIPYAHKRGYVGSYLEAGIYDQAFLMTPGFSISAVTGLQIANQQNIRIYSVTLQNASAVLPQLQVDEHVKSDIVAATNAGFEVTVPQSDITVASFSGSGYIIFDPQTGAGQYLISGGRNGDSSPAPASVSPVPQVQATAAVGLMLSMALRGTGASLMVDSAGAIAGVAIPAGIALGAIIIIVAAIIVATAITAAVLKEVDRLYPRISLHLRHYTSGERFVKIVSIARALLARDLDKPEIFFAAPEIAPLDREINQVGCPPSSAESLRIATYYEIPTPQDPPDPSRAETYIDVLVTRDNFYPIVPKANSHGVIEMKMLTPIVPLDGSFGVEFLSSCPGGA